MNVKHAFQSVFHCKHRIVWYIRQVASVLETWHCNGECYLDCGNRTMIKMKQSKQASQPGREAEI